jgi:phage tail tape-measure protein
MSSPTTATPQPKPQQWVPLGSETPAASNNEDGEMATLVSSEPTGGSGTGGAAKGKNPLCFQLPKSGTKATITHTVRPKQRSSSTPSRASRGALSESFRGKHGSFGAAISDPTMDVHEAAA